MILAVSLREDLIGKIREYIVTNLAVEERLINFFSSTSELLAQIPFDDLINQGNVGGKVSYLFNRVDSNILRYFTISSGTVQTFKIPGKLTGGVLDENFIVGSVGAYSSNADMKFNRIYWSSGLNITITNLLMVMK